MAKKFALIGAGGYVAPKHLKAIKDVGGQLIAAVDKHDSLGILDSYFPNADVFTEIERFERHLEKLKRQNNPVDYVSICTPNYLHDSHIRLGLRSGANVICEKPLVINPDNIWSIRYIEKETGRKVYPVLQLRLHPKIKELKKREYSSEKKVKVYLDYLTPRGNWYDVSWKAKPELSGGMAMNIGIHFFDMLIYLFGEVQLFTRNKYYKEITGSLTLEKAEVSWRLSIEGNEPKRFMLIDDEEIDFTDGFTDLHTEVYKEILEGRGNSIEDTHSAIELVNNLGG